jgi:hypothetical protein
VYRTLPHHSGNLLEVTTIVPARWAVLAAPLVISGDDT